MMIRTNFSYLLLLLIINVYFSFATGTFIVNERFLDTHPLSINNEYLALRMGFTYPSTSGSDLEIDVTSILGGHGFLQIVPNVVLDNCLIKSDNDVILLTAPLNSINVNSITCVVPVTISKIPNSNTEFKYSFRLIGSSEYPDSTEFSATFLDFLTNPVTEKPMLLFPDLTVNDSLVYEQDPDDNGIFKGKLTSTLTMSSPQNVFAKNAKISLLFSATLSANTLNECIINQIDHDNNSKVVQTLTPPNMNLNGQAIPLTEMTVSNKYMIVCDLTTYTPIFPGKPSYSIIYYFPVPYNTLNDPINGLYMYTSKYELPYASLSVSELEINSQYDPHYQATIDITDVNRPIYLHNMANYGSNVEYTIDDSIYSSVASLIPDTLSIKFDLSVLEPQYQTGLINITIHVTNHDQLLISPYLSSSKIDNLVPVSKTIIDFKPLYFSVNSPPSIASTMVEIPDLGMCVVMNTNVAHYVYLINFPRHITMRGLDANGIYESDNYIIRPATPNELSTYEFPGNTGVNYVLILKKQQTDIGFPALPTDVTANNINNISNFVFLPITLDVKTPQKTAPNYYIYFSYRSPMPVPTQPLYSTLKILQYDILISIYRNPSTPVVPVKMKEHFTIITNITLYCDIHSINMSLVMNSNQHFAVQQCEVEGLVYTDEDSLLTYDTNSFDTTFSFTTQIPESHNCSTRTGTYITPISCLLLRSDNPSFVDEKKTNLLLSLKSNISKSIDKRKVIIPLSSGKTQIALKMKNTGVNYKANRVFLQFGVNLMNVTPTTHLKYYFIYTDNFKSKPLKCNYPIFMKVQNHIVIGPIIQTSVTDHIINCELEFNRKYVEAVSSIAYIVEQDHYLPLMNSATSFDNLANIAASYRPFNISPNTNINDDSVSTIFDHFTLFNNRN